MEYSLIRQSRKTIAIYIKNGAVEVRAPHAIAQRDIDEFVEKKRDWIEKNLTKNIEKIEKKAAFELHYGDMVCFRGNEYPITSQPGNRAGFDGLSFWMPPDLTAEQIKNTCIQIYRLFAKQVITEKTIKFAKQMNVMPSNVKINSSKTRWGSCSSKKSLNFSYLLMMADDSVIDYVVVHELAHLTEMNHSDRFWAIVENVLPSYKQLRMQLKELQTKLSGEDWA